MGGARRPSAQDLDHPPARQESAVTVPQSRSGQHALLHATIDTRWQGVASQKCQRQTYGKCRCVEPSPGLESGNIPPGKCERTSTYRKDTSCAPPTGCCLMVRHCYIDEALERQAFQHICVQESEMTESVLPKSKWPYLLSSQASLFDTRIR